MTPDSKPETPEIEMPEEIKTWITKRLDEKYDISGCYPPGWKEYRSCMEVAYFEMYRHLMADKPRGIPEDEYLLDISGLPFAEKEEFSKGFMQITAKSFLQAFVMLGLKTHMETGVINEPTGDFFILSFQKVKEGQLPPQQEIASLTAQLAGYKKHVDDYKELSLLKNLQIEKSEADIESLRSQLVQEKNNFDRVVGENIRLETQLTAAREEIKENEETANNLRNGWDASRKEAADYRTILNDGIRISFDWAILKDSPFWDRTKAVLAKYTQSQKSNP